MRTQCEKCNCKLSKKEIESCTEHESDFPVRFICDECYFLEANNEENQINDYSDADSGL